MDNRGKERAPVDKLWIKTGNLGQEIGHEKHPLFTHSFPAVPEVSYSHQKQTQVFELILFI
jgi:hypothetical protein